MIDREQRKQFNEVVWEIFDWIEDDDERYEAYGQFQEDFFGTIDMPKDGPGPVDMVNAMSEEEQAFIGGAVVEEFLLSGDYPAIDEYLDEHELPELSRDFVRGLQRATRSFYEVIKVVPGQIVTLRDMVRPSEDPIVIKDEDAANALNRFDTIFARITDVRGHRILSPFSLPIEAITAREAADFIASVQRQAAEAVSEEEAWKEAMWNAAPIAIVSYIKFLYSQHQLQAMDEVTFRFSLRIPAKEMASKLAKVKEFVLADEPLLWLWKPGRNPNDPPSAAIIIEGDSLFVSGASIKKVKAAIAKIEKDLRLKLGKGEKIERVEDEEETLFDEDEDEDGDITSESVVETLRAQLDEPVEELEGMTMRQLSKIPHMRPMVETWLKEAERQTAALGSELGEPLIDFRPLWAELGLTYPEEE